jgi:predicted hotdog family 3-hydroxylacyl-ACP dehydratase
MSSTSVRDVKSVAHTMAGARRALLALEAVHQSLDSEGASPVPSETDVTELSLTRHLNQLSDRRLMAQAVAAVSGNWSATVAGHDDTLQAWAALPHHGRVAVLSSLQRRVQEHSRALEEATEVGANVTTVTHNLPRVGGGW